MANIVHGLLGAALAAALSLAATQAPAQSSLLDQGRSLLDRFGGGSGGGLTESKIADGLREALKIGSENVTKRLGRMNGFNANKRVHIPLPGSLATAQETLKKFGFGALGDDLELRLNRAAEAAVPKAKSLFLDAISEMTLDDAKAILDGPDDAATKYFQGKMTKPLGESFRPIVQNELSAAGAVKAYDDMIGKYKSLPFVPDAKAELTGYVVDKALDGVFLFLAREERAIRKDPARRTTELLKEVFGG